jgi:hypothetical protein
MVLLKKKQREELGHIRPVLKGGSIETRPMAIAKEKRISPVVQRACVLRRPVLQASNSAGFCNLISADP